MKLQNGSGWNKLDSIDMALRVCVCLGATLLAEAALGLGSMVIEGAGAMVPVSAIVIVGAGSLVSSWLITGRRS